MARTTILDAVVQVLESDRKSRTPKEILAEVSSRGLYTFGAADPVAMIRATLRKHLRTHGAAGQDAARIKHLEGDRYTVA